MQVKNSEGRMDQKSRRRSSSFHEGKTSSHAANIKTTDSSESTSVPSIVAGILTTPSRKKKTSIESLPKTPLARSAGAIALPLQRTATGGESPDSGSLYSDEIPSGYNSGEQYDTISTGYMSGEAYELPDTRMDLREPSLDVIEESHGAGSLSKSDDYEEDGDVFLVPPPPPVIANSAITGVTGSLKGSLKGEDNDDGSTTSSDHDEDVERGINPGEGPPGVHGQHSSPISYGSMKTKLRKKVTTFAIPIEASPLPVNDNYDESSDAAAATGGYRAVPSDTDTSALDSDANAIMTETGTDSGTDLISGNRPLIKQQGKKAKRKERKRMEEHDDAWFMAHDNKYWSATRFICFWGSILSMLGATIAAVILIFLMPRNCDPNIDWYRGTVTLDVAAQPGRLTDFQELIDQLQGYRSMGIQTVHLRDLSKDWAATDLIYHPTSKIMNMTSGTGVKDLSRALHKLNMTLMVQVPIVGDPDDQDFRKGIISLKLEQQVENAVKFFMEQGSDGIFLDGLEHFGADDWVSDSVMSWKKIIDRFGITNRSRILMTSYKFAHNLDLNSNDKGKEALKMINLLDATLDLDPYHENSQNFTDVYESFAAMAAWDSIEERPWINWNLKTEKIPLTNAALALQMLLPGTINIKSVGNANVKNMTNLRAVAVPIFMNGNYKPCHCDDADLIKETNYYLHQPIEYVVQLERFYSRRHRYVLVANFGHKETDLSAVGRIYSGGELVLDTSDDLPHLMNTEVMFKTISLPPGEAIVIKLPK